jgi:hypothetical protein
VGERAPVLLAETLLDDPVLVDASAAEREGAPNRAAARRQRIAKRWIIIEPL